MVNNDSSTGGSKRGRTILIAVVVLLLGGIGIGGYYVYQRGLKRENLSQQAQQAVDEKRYEDAIRLYRETLAAEPDHPSARRRILLAMVDGEMVDEAWKEGRELMAIEKYRPFATQILCELALRLKGGTIDDAERLARGLVDENPEYAYQVLALIEDFRGIATNDWRKRLEAAATRRSLASVTESQAAKTEALIFAASVTLEVAPFLPNRSSLMTRVREDLEEAVISAGRARQESQQYLYEVGMALIRVHSEDERDAEGGAKTLRGYISGAERYEPAVFELAKYHLRRDEHTEALSLIWTLEDTYLWNRLFWLLRHSNKRDVALQMLERGPLAGTPEYDLIRADLLLQGEDKAEVAEARTTLEAIINDGEASTSRVLRALVILALRTDLETARDVADAAKVQDRDDSRIAAFLASLLSAEEGDKARGLEIAEELAKTAVTGEDSQILRMLMGGGGGAAVESYLNAQVEKGGESNAQARLQRAVALLSRARRTKDDAEGAENLRKRVLKDLEKVKDDSSATKASLVVAFNLASSIGESKLAGAFAGRAAALAGSPEMLDARLLHLALQVQDDDILAELADGVRSVAEGTKSKHYVNAIAQAIATRVKDRRELLDRFAQAADKDEVKQPALELAARIALGLGEFVRAEAYARRSMEVDADSASARELLGATMLQREAYQDVIDLHLPTENRSASGYVQLVGAYLALGLKDDALSMAREGMRTHPQSIPVHIMTARCHLDLKEERKALSVLNVAPNNAYVAHMRAELLHKAGDLSMAQQLYEVLLVNSRFVDIQAWRGLQVVLHDRDRVDEFVSATSRVLDTPVLEKQPKVRATLMYLRGMSFEKDGKVEDAITEYESCARLDNTNWLALNNAAWHIATVAPARVADALVYLKRALELEPENPSVLDTAAEVYSVLGKPDEALGFIDKALALKPEGRVGKFRVHRARILLRAEREDEAKALLEQIRKDFAGEPTAEAAREVLWEIERKNMPEREREEIILPPEDEDEGDEDESDKSGADGDAKGTE